MSWLGAEDFSSTQTLRALLSPSEAAAGDAAREILGLWRTECSLAAESEWIDVLNELAVRTPGTLAHRAASDTRMPARFRVVAPSYQALGWRVLSPAEAEDELMAILQHPLLGEGALRKADAAQSAARHFVNLFGPGGDFITNLPDGDDEVCTARSTGAWATACPLTPAIAEAGVVGVGGGLAGLLWCAEN